MISTSCRLGCCLGYCMAVAFRKEILLWIFSRLHIWLHSFISTEYAIRLTHVVVAALRLCSVASCISFEWILFNFFCREWNSFNGKTNESCLDCLFFPFLSKCDEKKNEISSWAARGKELGNLVIIMWMKEDGRNLQASITELDYLPGFWYSGNF